MISVFKKAASALSAVFAVTATFAIVSCTSFTITPPSDFAVYQQSGFLSLPFGQSNEIKAITADGVRFRVSEVKNEPVGNDLLWQKTVVKGLERKGYHIIATSTVRTDEGRTLQLIDSQISTGGEDYSYLTAFLVDGSRIILIEVAGVKELMQLRNSGLRNSLKSLIVK